MSPSILLWLKVSPQVDQILRTIPAALGSLRGPSHGPQSPFYHPRFIECLLCLDQTSNEFEDLIVDQARAEFLCSPLSPEWIADIQRLLRVVKGPARGRLLATLLEDVYDWVEDLPDLRAAFVYEIALPLLEHEGDDTGLLEMILPILVRAAVSDTQEQEIALRRSRRDRPAGDIKAEDSAPLPRPELTEIIESAHFAAIRDYLITKAASSTCRCAQSGQRQDAETSNDRAVARSDRCPSFMATTSLIAIFNRLVFADAPATNNLARMPAASRGILLFRDLLALLYPMTGGPKKSPQVPARCMSARLTILQWSMRFRADAHHRLRFDATLPPVVRQCAAAIRRCKDGKIVALYDEDRGRTSRTMDANTRSRSRSKQPASLSTSDQATSQLWSYPDELHFELPVDAALSDTMLTFDPDHPSFAIPDSPMVEGLWLPVSEYVRTINGILRGHDWEMVSYILCFLPAQLANKVYFHGTRAVKEVRGLVSVLSDGVINTSDRWEKRFGVPSHITRVQVNAVAYQSLSVLIAYRGILAKEDGDRLVRAFMTGLEGRRDVAKPCLQALTLCLYEVEDIMARHLSDIIERMQKILSTTAIAIHILEFLIVLAQHASIFRNFTDGQYRLVFAVATGYIAEHNARSDQPVDLAKSREEFILSQHVIGLAYHSIYLWFMALRLSQRPGLISEITRNLLHGRSTRVLVDEMAEVCFDWLARYTYGNADPRPADSFLAEMVDKDPRESGPPKSRSWLLGGGIITVIAHARSGWATITTTRPTGSTKMICKVENVPLIDLGENKPDLTSLLAFLMANRLHHSTDIAEISGIATAEPEVTEKAHSDIIWAGAAPSQRRKDVGIDPSYIGLQVLSAYPVGSLDTPRGRLIPSEEKFGRMLRMIESTQVIDTLKIAVLYVGPGQSTEREILGNEDGSQLYLDFLSGLGRLIKLNGQVDVFVGGLDREHDSDGEYAYAWWDDLDQTIFHTPTMMPNNLDRPNHEQKKRLVGNDYVKIVYNDSNSPFIFDTIKTEYNFINIVVSPLGASGVGVASPSTAEHRDARAADEPYNDWDREEHFMVTIQRAPGIPEFGPIGEGRVVSRRALPRLVRQFSHMANDMSARFVHIRNATNSAEAEYISSWRARIRSIGRLRAA